MAEQLIPIGHVDESDTLGNTLHHAAFGGSKKALKRVLDKGRVRPCQIFFRFSSPPAHMKYKRIKKKWGGRFLILKNLPSQFFYLQ